jgi:hypothetical protein
MDRREELAELTRKWTPPPELSGTGMREVTLSRSGVGVLVAAAFFAVGGVVLGIALVEKSVHESNELAAVHSQGQDTEGRITRLWREDDKERTPRVTYEIQVDGRAYGRAARAPLKVWKSLSMDSPLPIRYLPSDPSHSHPRDWAEPALPLAVGPFVGMLMAGVGVLFVVFVQRQKALLRDGRPAPAIITRSSRGPHGEKFAHYEFALLGGSVMKGKSGSRRKLPTIGDTLCVIYDRDNPKRNATYPLDLVRVPARGDR